MDKLIVRGGRRLKGRIRISGSKNASLPILFAAMMSREKVVLDNIPNLRDIGTTIKLLDMLGCRIDRQDDSVSVAGLPTEFEAPYDLVRTMRASVLCLGPLLGCLGRARVALPGGCAIGARPVDLHLKALELMGAAFKLESGYIQGECRRLQGARIHFDFPTVGGTENILMAAVLAQGRTVLENAAREPEVTDLCNFLNACGARITGQGTSVLKIEGVDRLHGCQYRVMPDRIEAGTYMVAAAITQGELFLEDCPVADLDSVVHKLREMGVWLQEGRTGLLVRSEGPLVGVDVMTQPHPGFPTDMQAQIMALMCVSQGSGLIEESIFENRFMHVLELVRMGARIRLSGQTAVIRGVEKLQGAPVMASDLRASACLVLAGLAAEGRTEVRRIYHLDRGYEGMEIKLRSVGADIERAAQ
jgi:UDP-N-acetylglucosamine 1-carboxyvinyltransferase